MDRNNIKGQTELDLVHSFVYNCVQCQRDAMAIICHPIKANTQQQKRAIKASQSVDEGEREKTHKN